MPRFLILLLLLSSTLIAREVSSPCLLEHVQNHLPHCGTLKILDGFVYVDVDDEYIHTLIKYIQEEGFEEPPYFGPGLVGAHISVIFRAEEIHELHECGQIIDFIPIECQVVTPARWNEMEEVFFIVVEAPELDRIRACYGLPPKEFPYHITIGVKPKVAQAA